MFKEKYGPWALIIGGSEGIGSACAVRLAAEGLNLLLVARKADALEHARRAALDAGPVEVRTLSLDMSAPEMMDRLRSATQDLQVGLLIYNAGAISPAGFFERSAEEHLRGLRLNCDAPMLLAHHFGRFMRDRGRGGIIQLSSVAGLIGSYALAVYGATKAFDLQFAEGLWLEMREHGVDVLGVVIGSTRTPLMERELKKIPADAVDPDEVAQAMLKELPNGPVLHYESIMHEVATLRATDRRAVVTARAEMLKSMFT